MKIKANILVLLIAFAGLFACGGTSGSKEPDDKPVKPIAPTDVHVEFCTKNTLAFAWDAVSGADSYNYRLLKGNTLDRNGNVVGTSVSFNNLESETSYKFEVAAVAGSETSPWSARVEVVTANGDIPEPVPGPDPIPDVYSAMQIPAAEEDGTARAFPGAEGGGMYATGGRGGKVLHVTSIKDGSEEGTLRWAVSQKGARTVVFDVAGIIELKSTLKISNGDLTIAGQTAPGDGICLKNYPLQINASNVIVRFIRCRMGDETGAEDDALSASHKDGSWCSDIIIDHCSVSWSTDECASFYGNENFTLQYCIISESLRTSVHGKGTHGYGGLWGGNNASFHHNLLIHHDSRNPRFDHDYLCTARGPVHFINNVIYNWGGNSGYGGESRPGCDPRQINIVNNWYRPGEGSSNRARIVNPTTKCSNCNPDDQYSITPGLFYVSGNFMYGSDKVTADNWEGVEPDDKNQKDKVRSDSFMGSHKGTLHNAEEAMESVLTYAGASLARDRIDTRLAKETREGSYTYKGSKGGTKGIIDTQEDVGGWPAYKASDEQLAIVTDTDLDGIPDWYETLFGLDGKDSTDAALSTIDPEGRYTNLEMYLHYLVKDIVKGQNANGQYTEIK